MRRIALAVLLVTSVATANTGTDDESGSTPVAVRAKLVGISAHIVVDYRLTTDADNALVTFELPVPFGAVVTAATITQGGVARRMTLDKSETVATRFQDVFGGQDSSAKPTAWVAKITVDNPPQYGGYLATVSIGAPIKATVGLSLEVVAPTCFFRDKRYVRAPIEWQRAVRGKQPIAAAIEQCARPIAGEDAWIEFPAPHAARRSSGDRLVATTARLAIHPDLHLARTELVLGENLADIPRDLATVILVDESRSMDDAQRRTQREIVLGYLRAAPASRVQVLAFSRKARPLLPAWTIASRARARLDRELATLAPRNGSNFDVGLADAGALLAAIEGTRRVVLVTDEAMASHLAEQPARFASHVPQGTIIHVVVPNGARLLDPEDNPLLVRDDTARLASLAAATTGIATMAGESQFPNRTAIDASMLVRPISLDHVRATGLGWDELQDTTREAFRTDTCTGSIDAGASCVWRTRGTRFAGPIQLEGMLWNQRVVRLVRPLGDAGHTIAREIVGTGASIPADSDPNTFDDGADTKLAARIDALAHAVTSSTSLFARWGGDVLFSDPIVFGGIAGFGRSGTIGHPHTSTPRPVAPPPVDLSSQLRPLVAHCKLEGRHAVVSLEITFQEIVDVEVAVAPAAGDMGDAQKRCIEEAVWDFTPALPSLEPFRTARVVL